MRGLRCLPAALALTISVIAGGTRAHASGLPPIVPAVAQTPWQGTDLPAPGVRSGSEIFERFRAGLANPQCDAAATSQHWKRHFRHASSRLTDPEDNLLPLFGYVVDELDKAGLPTEFALIPFVESGYRPEARSKAGPAGLWQFIATTARNHKIPMSGGVDGRLSASESTTAAVRYLKTLHGMFGGRWELAVMGYNAGEYRILQSLRRSGLNATNATPQALAGLSPVTYSYVEKLHALSCVLEDAAENGSLMAELDRPVPVLASYQLPAGGSLQQWANERELDVAKLARINPLARTGGRAARTLGVLAPVHAGSGAAAVNTALASATEAGSDNAPALAATATAAPSAAGNARRHTVRNGDSLWAIARRHGISVASLLNHNNLGSSAVLRPGMVLLLETPRN
jgi:membrane-bound lytic murein transglycosylase D